MILSSKALASSLQGRLESGRPFAGRSTYTGASEIGTCLRHVVAAKLNPIPFDPASMGRMLAGRVLENEIVQLVRTSLGASKLRDTGRSQRELIHSTIPFRAHPDGRIIGDGGDILLEVKTASSATFKRYVDSGLPAHYHAQVQSQMGLSGVGKSLVVLASREDLSQIQSFGISFDPKQYADLEDRARLVAAHLEAHTLPDGEPDRGFCHTCPLSGQCAALQDRKEAGKRGELPEVLRLQLDAQVEELAVLEAALDPMQERAAELREQIRQALDMSGAIKVSFDLATIQLVATSRTSFDSKALQRDQPETYGRFLKTATFTTMRFTRKGDFKCQTIVS